MKNSANLKPCPFCGEAVDLYAGVVASETYAVRCNKCRAQGRAYLLPEYDARARGFAYWERRLTAAAKAAWNKRSRQVNGTQPLLVHLDKEKFQVPPKSLSAASKKAFYGLKNS